ncbi:MAG: S4A5 electrogenic sodium bicarbonate cotransporter 4 [Eggerthellaceae bacterium]|nr:S4A5 electrogenic sodium bicarbonate cotransporter 4 [Eggerthellaceae bacterium]
MPPQPTKHIKVTRDVNVRIGPISVITLIAVVCMAVLAVLAAATSHATGVYSDRQAIATEQLYANERAAQEFVASIDDALAGVRAAGGSVAGASRAAELALDGACEAARTAGSGRVECTASVSGASVTADFICDGARELSIAITIRDDATYRIDKWKMTSTQQEAAAGGTLWSGA